jgi:GT2 family glycosyltransferase
VKPFGVEWQTIRYLSPVTKAVSTLATFSTDTLSFVSPVPMSRAELSIIFVNWNSTDYLRQSLRSVYENTQGLRLEIIIVDNASPDGRADLIKAEFPEITLIKSSENLGFARANNLGVQHSAGDFILFLNPDTRLIGPAITTMLERLKSLPGAGIVGCSLLKSDLDLYTSSVQPFPTILNQTLNWEWLKVRLPGLKLWGIAPLFSGESGASEVEMVSGACLMIKRPVLERVGLFSSEYFMYAEDLDLCYKVHELGFKTYYVKAATVVHYGGGSSQQKNASQWATIMQKKAVSLFLLKTRGPIYCSMFKVAMGMGALCRLLIITLLLPLAVVIRKQQEFYLAFAKWMAILRWAAGLDQPV